MTRFAALLLVAFKAATPTVVGTVGASLKTPAHFYHHGVLTPAQNVLVIRVRIDDRNEFVPRALPSSLFFYGHAMCEFLDSPIVRREVSLLCPQLSPGERAVLWTARPLAVSEMTSERTESLLQQSVSAHLAAKVPAPPGRATSYEGREELQRALRRPPGDGGVPQRPPR